VPVRGAYVRAERASEGVAAIERRVEEEGMASGGESEKGCEATGAVVLPSGRE